MCATCETMRNNEELLEAGAIMDMDSASSPLELAAGCGTQSVEGKTGVADCAVET